MVRLSNSIENLQRWKERNKIQLWHRGERESMRGTHRQAVSRRQDPLCSAVMAPHHHGVWECARLHKLFGKGGWEFQLWNSPLLSPRKKEEEGKKRVKSHSASPRQRETPAAGHFQTAADKKQIMTVIRGGGEGGWGGGCSTVGEKIERIFSQIVRLSGSGRGAAVAAFLTRRAQNSKLKRSRKTRRRPSLSLPLSLPACVGVQPSGARSESPAGTGIWRVALQNKSADAALWRAGVSKRRTKTPLFKQNVPSLVNPNFLSYSPTLIHYWIYIKTLILKSTPESGA